MSVLTVLETIQSHIEEFEASIARLEESIADPVNTFSGREYDAAIRHGQKGAVQALRRLRDVIETKGVTS